MARYQVTLSYDGTDFHGFQRQGSARTVQLEVEQALLKMGWQGKAIISSGRTDTGVHASGQVIVFNLEWKHSLETLLKAFNAHLPEDVAAREVKLAADGFHPRFDAIWRYYEYTILVDPLPDPLRERYIWRIESEPDETKLHEAAHLLIGCYDFRSFGSPMKKGGNTVREIYNAEWKRDGKKWIFCVKANAFLYHMVRRLVYNQIMVGQNRMSLETFREGVQSAQAIPPGVAPPNGLVLVEVGYPR